MEARGGFDGGGGGAYRFSAPIERAAPVERSLPEERNLNQGYSGSHPLYGAGSRTPRTGQNIPADQFRRSNTGGWYGADGIGGFDNDRFNRQVNLENNFYNRNVGGWNNGWADGSYWGSRPWGWWGGSSVGWGLAALAGAEVITALVNDAAAQQSPAIDVPDSDYQLNYGTVDSVGSGGADFSYAAAGSPPVKGAANCQQGLLDGQVPSTAAQIPRARPYPRASLVGCPDGCAICSCWPWVGALPLAFGSCWSAAAANSLQVPAATMPPSPQADSASGSPASPSSFLIGSIP